MDDYDDGDEEEDGGGGQRTGSGPERAAKGDVGKDGKGSGAGDKSDAGGGGTRKPSRKRTDE